MKYSQHLAMTVVCVASLTTALAEEQAPDLYAQATNSYKRGECILSIELFNRYKAENKDKLKEHKGFLKKINDAINDCKEKLLLGRYEKELIANLEADEDLDSVLAHIKEAMESMEANESVGSKEKGLALIKKARRLIKARSAYRKNALESAEERLEDAEKSFESLKNVL